MAKMQIFKGPGKTVLNGSAFYKTILICMHKFSDDSLEPVGKYFGDQIARRVEEGDGPIIRNCDWALHFWDEGNVGSVNTLWT